MSYEIEADDITDPGPIPINEPSPYGEQEAKITLKEEAVQHLISSFGFTEETARVIVGI